MKVLKRRGTIPMLIVGGIALLSQIASRNVDRIYQATAPEAVAVEAQIPASEVWTVKEGSVYLAINRGHPKRTQA